MFFVTFLENSACLTYIKTTVHSSVQLLPTMYSTPHLTDKQ